MTGALERRKAGFVGAALTALQCVVAALPGIKTSDALAALLSLAEPKDRSSVSPSKASQARGLCDVLSEIIGATPSMHPAYNKLYEPSCAECRLLNDCRVCIVLCDNYLQCTG